MTATQPPADPTPQTPGVPAGWYPFPENSLNRWWDGTAWGVYAPAAARPVVGAKDTTVTYLLFFFLGGFGAHHFYLGNIVTAIVQIVLWWGGWALSIIGIGFFMLAAVVIWWIVDLFSIRGYVRLYNSRAAAAAPVY